jgi:hypothetical protein
LFLTALFLSNTHAQTSNDKSNTYIKKYFKGIYTLTTKPTSQKDISNLRFIKFEQMEKDTIKNNEVYLKMTFKNINIYVDIKKFVSKGIQPLKYNNVKTNDVSHNSIALFINIMSRFYAYSIRAQQLTDFFIQNNSNDTIDSFCLNDIDFMTTDNTMLGKYYAYESNNDFWNAILFFNIKLTEIEIDNAYVTKGKCYLVELKNGYSHVVGIYDDIYYDCEKNVIYVDYGTPIRKILDQYRGRLRFSQLFEVTFF